MSEGVLLPCGGLWSGRIWRFETLPSTNRWALEHSDLLRHGDVVHALSQTAGRGRFQRKWHSSAGNSLTASFCLDFQDRLPPAWLPAAAALAVRSAAATFGVPASVKWPNDVLCKNAKLAGILAEQDTARPGRIILGIGINVQGDAGRIIIEPGHLPAMSIYTATGKAPGIEYLLQEVCRKLELYLPRAEDGSASLAEEWSQFDALTGRDITISTAAGDVAGRYAGISADGRLSLQDRSGTLHHFWAGDVSVRAPHTKPPAAE